MSLRIHIAKTFVRQALGGILQLVSTLIIANFAGYEILGSYANAMLLPIFSSQLFAFSIGSSTSFHIASGLVSSKASAQASILYSILLGPTSALVTGCFYLLVHNHLFPHANISILLIAAIACPFLLFNELSLGVLQGDNCLNEYNLAVFLQPLSFFVVTIVLAIIGSLTLPLIIVAWILSQLIQSLYSFLVLSAYGPIGFTVDFFFAAYSYCVKVFPYASKCLASNIITLLIYRLDIYLVYAIAGNTAAGIYFLAIRLTEQFWLFSSSASAVLLPRLTSDYAKTHHISKDVSVTPEASRLVFLTTSLTSFGFIVMFVIYSRVSLIQDFATLMTNIIILSIGVILFSVNRLLANDNAARGFLKLNLISSLLVLVLNCSFDILLIPNLSSIGAALATSIAYASSFAFQILIQKAIYSIPFSDFVPKASDLVNLKAYLISLFDSRNFLNSNT